MQSHTSAGASTQNPKLDGNGAPRSGMQREAEMSEKCGGGSFNYKLIIIERRQFRF